MMAVLVFPPPLLWMDYLITMKTQLKLQNRPRNLEARAKPWATQDPQQHGSCREQLSTPQWAGKMAGEWVRVKLGMRLGEFWFPGLFHEDLENIFMTRIGLGTLSGPELSQERTFSE